MASKPINIHRIRTNSQPYLNVMFSIVLKALSTKIKIKIIEFIKVFLAFCLELNISEIAGSTRVCFSVKIYIIMVLGYFLVT